MTTTTITKSELYLQKAEQFEAMAHSAHEDATKATYRYLAFAYRQLGLHIGQSPVVDTQPDDHAARHDRDTRAP